MIKIRALLRNGTLIQVLFPFLLSISCMDSAPVLSDEMIERELMRKNHICKWTEFKAITFAGIKQNEFPVFIREFYSDGKVRSEKQFSKDSLLDCLTSLYYNTAGNLDSTIALNADSSLLYRILIDYDEKGRRKELFFYLPDGTYKYRNVSEYNSENQLMVLSWYWPDGFKAKNVYLYSGSKLMSDTELGPGDVFHYVWNYVYDSGGHLVLAEQRYPDRQINSRILYKYDDAGNRISEIHENRTGFQSRIEYSYNTAGLRMSAREFSASGRVTAEHRYDYEYFK